MIAQNFNSHRYVILLVLLVAGLVSCSPTETLRFEDSEFRLSEVDKQTFLDEQLRFPESLQSLSGRASVQVSEPGQTERLTVRFRSTREQSLMTIRNNLGIEGGRIYSNPDSVIIYNRIEEIAHKMSQADASWYFLNGVGALNIIEMLFPVTSAEQIYRIYENKDHFLVETVDGERHFINRENGRLLRTELPAEHPDAYRFFQFENYAQIDGYLLPRRIQILSADEKSNIFFVIRALEINPSSLEFDPEIPQDTEIIQI